MNIRGLDLSNAVAEKQLITAARMSIVLILFARLNFDSMKSTQKNLLFASASELAKRIRQKKISARELLELHLSHLEETNPRLNAVVILGVDAARARAKAADEALARGELWGPLHGVPFTLKDAHATAGLRTTMGLPALAKQVPREDGTVAARLKNAGGILFGKTNIAMGLADFQSNNPVFGQTNNPWNPERTAGGSSGGAAAAVAAGLTPFDVGTDLSASIRIPAHFCGVFGFKPTENQVPNTGIFPTPHPIARALRIMLSIGPLARFVEDLDVIFNLIRGPDGQDSEVRPIANLKSDLDDLRIAFSTTFPGLPIASDITAAVRSAASRLSDAGFIVEEAALPKMKYPEVLASAGELIGAMLGAFEKQDGAKRFTAGDYFTALQRRDETIAAWEEFFTRWDVLLAPSSMTTAFPHTDPGTPLIVNRKEVNYFAVSAHGTMFNYTGQPAVCIPAGMDRAGLPIGLQLVSRRWSDRRLLKMAHEIAPHIGEFKRPPSV
ncbi:MAG TPA: amidase [Opitutaceae bacterium]|nr:amidase [Opitutaceae bacterium]